MKTKRHLISVLLALAVLVIPTAVFAKELGLLIITGPGIKGDLTVSDPSVLSKLEGSGFFDQSNRLKSAPENLGEGYTITSNLNLDGTMTPFIKMVYYPVEEGRAGYIHMIGRLDGETLRAVDEWSQISPEADKFFRIVMAANDVTLQSAVVAAPVIIEAVAPQTQPEAQPASVTTTAPATPNQALYVALLGTLIAIMGAALLFRRTVNQRSV